MFVQVIQAKAKDPDALRQRFEVWQRDLKPITEGFLGSTAGIGSDGTWIVAARFESEEVARRNSDRPEQGEWWAETEKHIDGDAIFYDCTEVDEIMGGGSDDAGFVQVIQGYATDKAELRRRGAEMESLSQVRPDVLGGFVAWGPEDGFSQFMYFSSEEEARKGEKSESMDEGQAQEWQKLIRDVKYIDLTDPWLTTP